MKFRTDINGLRTYAVLAVIIFHFNKNWLPGGFAGVDVFFVISGYLMTSIIFRGIENNNFSLWKFYSARVRRIIPALLVLIVLLMIFGYLFLAPIPYRELAKHSGGSLLFISNFMYWLESGYFDAEAIEKFLLHTWSLSVEWQFYMIYPIALLLLSKIFSIPTLKKILVVGTIIAFFFAIYASFKWSVASYFLLPTRVWEMLLGGVVFLYPLKLSSSIQKHSLELIGLGLVVLSFFIISEQTVWPGYMALIPTGGAFLLLQANNQTSYFTNNLVMQKLGLWSYSLYLYHWPLLVINHKFNLQLSIWVFLIITIALSVLSYYFIEIKRWKVWHVLIVLGVVLIPIGGVYATKGASFRVDPKYRLSLQEFRNKYEGHSSMPNNGEILFFNSTEKDFDYILIGNSHARHLFSFLKDSNKKVAAITLDGCISTKNYYSNYNPDNCSLMYDKAINFINKNKNKKIIISNSWGGKANNRHGRNTAENFSDIKIIKTELENFLFDIKDASHKLYLIGKTQGSLTPAIHCLSQQELIFGFNCKTYNSKTKNPQSLLLKDVASKYDNVFFIDAKEALCDHDQCKIIVNGEPVYTDTNHLSIYGADIVGKYIFEKIRSIENQQK